MSDDKNSQRPDLSKEVDALMEGAAGLFGGLKEIFDRSREEIVRGARVGKAHIDIFQVRKDREAAARRLGERAFELMLAGQQLHEELDDTFAELRELNERLHELEEERDRMEAEADTQRASEGASEPTAEEPAAEAPVADEASDEPEKSL